MGQINIDYQGGLLLLLALVLTATVHEFAHAYAADRLGDDTARKAGRVSLIPLDQFDAMRGIALLLFSFCDFGFAWGKPVPIETANFKNPRRDDFLVAVCGPAVNLVLGGVFAIFMRAGYFHLPLASPWHRLIDALFQVNFITLIFNLVPLPPFDGHRMLGDLLSEKGNKQYQLFLKQWGWMLLVVTLFFGSSVVLFVAGRAQMSIGGWYDQPVKRAGAPAQIPSRPRPAAPSPAVPQARG